MTRKIMMFVLVTFAAVCAADDDPPGPQPAPRQAAADVPSGAPISRTDSGSDAADSAAAAGTNPARFATEARWATAGYNNEEIIYTILVTNQDSLHDPDQRGVLRQWPEAQHRGSAGQHRIPERAYADRQLDGHGPGLGRHLLGEVQAGVRRDPALSRRVRVPSDGSLVVIFM
jgi:hypothetical protein